VICALGTLIPTPSSAALAFTPPVETGVNLTGSGIGSSRRSIVRVTEWLPKGDAR
jgi:hypothetical protein